MGGLCDGVNSHLHKNLWVTEFPVNCVFFKPSTSIAITNIINIILYLGKDEVDDQLFEQVSKIIDQYVKEKHIFLDVDILA